MEIIQSGSLYDPVRGASERDRFWTRTNTAEATPGVLTALEWDVFGDGLEQGFIRSMVDFGVLAENERVVSADPNERMTAVFYGRQAVNVDLLREVLARLPGLSPDDMERDLLGSVRPGLKPEPSAPRRWPIIAYRLPRVMLGLDRRVQRLHSDQLRWWQANVYDVYRKDRVPSTSAIDRLEESSARYASAFVVHSIIRWLLPVAERPVHAIADAVGRPDLKDRVFSGHGNLSEMALAKHIWSVGIGNRSLDSFLRAYGFHGPRTGNLTSHSWREQPEQIERLASRLRSRADLSDPADRENQARAGQAEAAAELLRATPRSKRPLLKFALQRSAGVTRKLELGKATYLMGLDGARAAARELGTALCSARLLDEPQDVFFLTRRELHELIDDATSNVSRMVAYRREQRQIYESGEVPISFIGDPQLEMLPAGEASATTNDVEAHDVAEKPAAPLELAGVAGGGGIARGRARIVVDPNEDIDFDEGDILVCKFTDPSWTPLFMMAAAAVIDIGGFSSHGAVVARELGIPYVIGTGDGSTRLRDQDLVEVDGVHHAVRRLNTV